MYSRAYGGRELNFEASGGLINASLVMQDRETSSYWSLMSGKSLAGEYEGTPVEELPTGEKVRWREWKAAHPDTLVLSVNGRQHAGDAYASYWTDPDGFSGFTAEDDRLETKTPIYAFRSGDVSYAVELAKVSGGHSFDVDGKQIFLYRKPNDPLFASTAAYMTSGAGFIERDGIWVHVDPGATFDDASGEFTGAAPGEIERLPGFDTFWYNWSLTNPDTELLE